MPFVLIDDDVDRSRHLLAGFEDMFDRCELIEFSAEDHEWTAKIGNPRSQIEALNEFIELGLVLVAGHEHETIFIGRRCLFENLGEARLETRKAKGRQRSILSFVLLADSGPTDVAGVLHKHCQHPCRLEPLAAY